MSLSISKYGAEFAITALSFEKATVNTYDVAAKSEAEPALKELEIVLFEMPKTNEFHIPFTTKDLVFYFQPPLNQELDPRDYDLITETEAFREGVRVVHRPENIVGSYAVYHAFRKGNEYMTGKAFHIYRPEAVDAKGNRAWADMKILDGEIIITVPQKFLDSAVYPMVIDPTFGYTSIGGSSTTIDSLNMIASSFPLTESGDITKITMYCKNAYGTYTVQAGIYSGSPTTLVVVSDAVAITTTASWLDFTVSTSQTPATLWLTGGAAQSGLTMYYDAGDAGQTHLGIGLFPSVWVDNGSQARKYSVYATYTASGGGGQQLFTLINEENY
jgi:hypothetical protein